MVQHPLTPGQEKVVRSQVRRGPTLIGVYWDATWWMKRNRKSPSGSIGLDMLRFMGDVLPGLGFLAPWKYASK
jgi:hypothetical protein